MSTRSSTVAPPATPPAPTIRQPGDAPLPGMYGRVTAWLAKRVEVALTEVDLTLPQYRILGVLTEGSAASSILANRLAVRPPSITAVIDGLVAKGLVERKHEDADRRRIALRITEKGELVIAEADLAVDAYLMAIASHLPDKDEVMALRSIELWGQAMASQHQATKANELKGGNQ